MESAPFSAYAGLALALVILQVCLFATGLRAFVAEERRKRAETAAQVLRSLEDLFAERKHIPVTCPSDTGPRHKLHKASVREPSLRSVCSTHKHNDHAGSPRPCASSSTPNSARASPVNDPAIAIASHKKSRAVSVGSSHARDSMHSTKLASGRTKRALPPLASPAHRGKRRPETISESGGPKISVSSGSRFYGNIVEGIVRANRGRIAPPTTPVSS